ncbi:AraC-type DNA-binding protein [Bradyrhizobium sp. Rc2d]|uniref:AraC family transcriptional regulator n=1 Tax=Bradyrhizobium sp. Rc2d TaxID=1855321 RepID=UPI000887320A|nr:helix-turn-helix transcriptional regulator [Bradyrhizobium sp. Rc2d]SDG53888.1 AraC-type DNA-binding protein [Bradyrhizobium sp. Rc2d]
MTVVETPILREVRGNHRSTAGVHLVARDYPKGLRIDPHLHREAQLIYAAKGTMQVTTPGGRWLVPPDRAVWVPAGLEHAIDLLADIEMRTLYFDLPWLKREQQYEGLIKEFVVRVSPLLHQAILALFDAGNTEARTELLVRLVMLELHQAEDSTTFVPLPREVRCRRAAMIVLDDPTGLHDIDTLARAVGTSARTLSRLFSTETQLSFKSWCQRARIAAAIQRLSTDANVSVKQLATQLGYASVPAFSAAFRQVTGRTPTEFATHSMSSPAKAGDPVFQRRRG